MDPSKHNFRCTVCDVNTSSLSELHKHQSTRHTSEELSLSILTLQSFLYHKHFFQSLDAQPLTDVCYFYPFCTQLFSQKGRNVEPNFRSSSASPQETVVRPECCSPGIKTPEPEPQKTQVPLRQPLPIAPRPTIIRPLSSLAKRSSPLPIAPVPVPDNHAAFLNSANSLCDDLIKLKGHNNSQSKTKRKRLNQKKDSQSLRKNSKQMVQKPPRKPKIDTGMKTDNPQQIPSPENLETLNIWASKSEESAALGTSSAVTLVENQQPIRLQSPTVPSDMLNCENALVFNPEIGSFQWNPLSCVELPEENGDATKSTVPSNTSS